jgi:NadR type nicotinamide-nucleotide adenylyltransferase
VNRRFARGLVVGKFSPLHRGHEHLLETAQRQCDKLYCITYALPELPGCGAAARTRWLSELFPSVEHLALDEAAHAILWEKYPQLPRLPDNRASELEDRVFVAQVCLQVLGTAVDAVFTSETYGDGFAAELTRQFGAALHGARSVEHVLVDLERLEVPISATRLRAAPELLWRFVAPIVNASFVRRVCLLGGESSGKTTLARRLAESFETTHAEEFGRDLWLERAGNLSFDDYTLIARTQIQWEERAARAGRRFTFCDSSPFTTLLYCLDQYGRAAPELYGLAERNYDLTLLCAPDIPFAQDGTRRDPAFRARQHEKYVQELKRRGARFELVKGSLDARLEQARRAVQAS